MKQDELYNIWKKSLRRTKIYSQEELDKMLTSKMRKIMRKHLRITGLSIFFGLLTVSLLIYTAIERKNDTFYVVNNIVSCAIVALFTSLAIWSFYKMSVNTLGLPLKDWLSYRIKAIYASRTQARYIIRFFAMILVFTSVYLSFFVYFINRPLIDVVTNESLYPALTIGFTGGLITSLLSVRNVRAYYNRSLAELEDLYNQFDDE